MPKAIDRLLDRAPVGEHRPSLGRVFSVVRETWLLSEDPQAVAPKTELIASRRTALEAADLAREAAVGFSRHGFHKPSGAWWASEDGRLHRFAVRRRPQAAKGLVLGSGLAALLAIAGVAAFKAAGRRSRRSRSRA